MEVLHNRTTVHLDWLDRLRAFCGKVIHVEVDVTVEQPEITVVKTESRTWVERIIPPRKMGGYAVMGESARKEQG